MTLLSHILSAIFLRSRNIFALVVMGGLYQPEAISMSLEISIVCISYKSITTLPQNECDMILHFLIFNLSNSLFIH